MHCQYTLLVLLASAIGTSARAIATRALKDNPDEGVYLVDCGSTMNESPSDLSVHDYVYYYNNDADGQKGEYPEITATPTDPGPHDGFIYHINWDSGTQSEPITADLQGRKFSLYNLEDDGSAKKGDRIKAIAKLDNEELSCYKYGGEVPDSLANGSLFKCSAYYRCTRDSHWSRSAKMILYNATTTVSDYHICGTGQTADPYFAFGQYSTWAETMQQPGYGYKLGGKKKCSISFSTSNVDQNSTSPISVGDVTRFWYSAVAPSIAKSIEYKEGQIDYCSITYPSGGYLAVVQTQDENPDVHDELQYHFQVSCEDKKCDSQTAVSVITNILGGIAGFATSLGAVPGLIQGGVTAANVLCGFG
ncbi:uncharacterized protein BDR25DRAFT_45395 [Lindgomyces ingoldianus]|uniref:Uncharacterized protein n=1 Tax=Lindgomyces ingoldianus TaxID=673940 RepID=A0ACB6RG55_9PLEO|nr:uncharacterized protein BDR25DRAFT_45395 [Lindgomyces ingoldianus]KAF2477305.1 hypothetical protein BDR25DRAFT_45395 [Lindgomyces ingoldianus]